MDKEAFRKHRAMVKSIVQASFTACKYPGSNMIDDLALDLAIETYQERTAANGITVAQVIAFCKENAAGQYGTAKAYDTPCHEQITSDRHYWQAEAFNKVLSYIASNEGEPTS